MMFSFEEHLAVYFKESGEYRRHVLLDEMNAPFTTVTCDMVMLDTSVDREHDMVMSILGNLATSAAKKEKELKKQKSEKTGVLMEQADCPSVDKIFMSVYRWFIGSGRILLFTARLRSAYIQEKMNPYFNLEFYNKEYRTLLELLNGRGISLEVHFFGGEVDIGDIYSLVSRTGGRLYYYKNFDLGRDGTKIHNHVFNSLTQDTGRFCNVSFRASAEIISVKLLTGSGELSGKIYSVNKIDEQTCLPFKFEVSKQTEVSPVLSYYIQCTALYTDKTGQRKARVTTCKIKPSVFYNDPIDTMTQDIFFSLMLRSLLQRHSQKNKKDIRDRLVETLAGLINVYKSKSQNFVRNNTFLVPDTLRFTLYIVFIMTIEMDTSIDEYRRRELTNSNIGLAETLLSLDSPVYDMCYYIDVQYNEDGFVLPARVPYREMKDDRLYVVNRGTHLVIVVGVDFEYLDETIEGGMGEGEAGFIVSPVVNRESYLGYYLELMVLHLYRTIGKRVPLYGMFKDERSDLYKGLMGEGLVRYRDEDFRTFIEEVHKKSNTMHFVTY